MGKKGKSRLQRLRARGKLLDEILAWKREEVTRKHRERPLSILRALAATVPPPADLTATLGEKGIHIIGEIVRATPTHGLLSHHFDAEALTRMYIEGGVSALAVVTDARFFQGRLEYVTTAKETLSRLGVSVPVIHRDFVIDPYQVWEARVAGADAIALNVTAVGDRTLRELVKTARALGMEPVLEVHDEEDLTRALAVGARLIGIENRDPRTFTVDLGVTERLRPQVPSEVLVVSEGGVYTVADVQRLAAVGVHAILVGEAVIRARPEDRLATVRAWVRAARGNT